jgi:hypothetical protein
MTTNNGVNLEEYSTLTGETQILRSFILQILIYLRLGHTILTPFLKKLQFSRVSFSRHERGEIIS